jgi:hypothetical protein
MEVRSFWHGVCLMSGMRNVNGKDYRDLKELIWDVYGQESYEAEMALRYMMETMEQCPRPEPEGNERKDGQSRREGV